MTTTAAPGSSAAAATAQGPARRHKRDAPTNAFDALFAAISANVSPSPQVPVIARVADSHGSTKAGAGGIAGDTLTTFSEPTADAVAESLIRPGASLPQPAPDAPNARDDERDPCAVPIQPQEEKAAAAVAGDPADIVPPESSRAPGVQAVAFAVRAGNRVVESQSASGAAIPRERSPAPAVVLRELTSPTHPPAPSGSDTPSRATTPVIPVLASPKSVMVDPALAVATGPSPDPRDFTDMQARPVIPPAITPPSPRDDNANRAAHKTDADPRSSPDASAGWVAPAEGKLIASARSELGRQRQLSLQAQAAGAKTQGPDVEAGASLTSPADAIATLVALGKAASVVTGDPTKRSAAVDADIDVAAGIGIGAAPLTGAGGSVSTPTASASTSQTGAFDEAAWREAMTRQVTAAAAAQNRETSVRLDAKGLGPIEVHVRVAAERVDVHFLIQRPVTADIVRDALPDLQRLLGQSGMTLGDASVAHQHAGGRGGDAASSSRTEARSRVDEAPGVASAEAPRIRLGLLDHFA